MAIIRSGFASDLLTIDSSKAARVSDYDDAGNYRDQKAIFGATAPSAGIPNSSYLFYMTGSSSKLVTIQRIRMTCMVCSAVVTGVASLETYRTPFSGGTLTYLSASPLDSIYGIRPTAPPRFYTAIPTIGVLVGAIGNLTYTTQASAAVATGKPPIAEWDFRNIGENSGIRLRGTDNGIALRTINAGALPMTACVEALWIEE